MSQDQAKQRILSRVDLTQLIGESIQLQKRSGRFVGLCPFHEEKSPSFTIFDDHYYCFGCQARGDAIDFVRQQKGFSFIETLKYLAERFQVDAPELEQRVSNDRERQQLKQIYQALLAARDFFQTQLSSEKGQKCRSYLAQRGFDETATDLYDFGYALDQPAALVSHLLRKGFSLETLNAASLSVSSTKTQRSYDFYRDRLMIPIYDHHGRLVAFGGRALGDDPAKYKNSRDTVVFDKSRLLYGFDRSRDSIKSKRRAIVVEGYMDALQLHHFGLTETTACLGTALTTQHVRRLSQICKHIYLVFDGDDAGKRASLKTVAIALEHPECKFSVIRLPSKEDPDSYIRKNGLEAFEDRISEASDLLTYAIETRLKESHDIGLPELIKRELTPWLRSIKDPVRRSFLISRISRMSGIDQTSIMATLTTPSLSQSDLGKKPAEVKTQTELPSNIESEQKLSAKQIEFLGHIYFTSHDEVDVAEIRIMLKRVIKLEGIWSSLCEEFLAYLEQSKASPFDRSMSEWSENISETVVQQMENFRKEPGLFHAENRMNLLRRISNSIQLTDLSSTRNALKQSLKHSSAEDITQILTSIQQLNKQMLELEKR